jgi:hypothetical protein
MILNKIDVRPILRGHFSTLRNNANLSPKLFWQDVVVFFAIPAVLAVCVLTMGFHFRVDAVNGFLNVFSVLTGLLLNLLVLVLTMATSKAPVQSDQRKRSRLVGEIFSNVCFAVLVSISVVCVALFALSYMRSNPGATTGPMATFFLVALTTNFVLTLLMVLKRMYILISKEIESDSSGQSRAA